MIRASEIAVRLLGVAGALACAAIVIGVERTPVVWTDEIVFTAASYNLMRTGSTVPSHQADIDSFLPAGQYYGPLYFRLTAAAIRTFGLHPWSTRLVGLLGGALALIGAYGLARAAGAPRRWAVAAASLVILTPDAGSAVTNGRPDMLAAGLETAALALVWQALVARSRPSAMWASACAGGLLGLAFLSTPRAFPAAVALALASPVLLFGGSGLDRRRRFAVIGVTGAVSAAILLGWATAAHQSPAAWIRYVGEVTAGDAVNVAPILGGARFTMFWSPAALTPAIALLAVAAFVARERTRSSTRAVDWYLLLTVWIQAVVYCGLVSTPLLRSAYWAVPLAAVTFALLVRSAASGSLAAVALVVLAGCGFAAGRAVKVTELAVTWNARDHARLERFMRDHVPSGATVTGLDNFYFYAIENAGAHFRGYAVLGQLPRSERRTRFEDQTRGERFFIWPAIPEIPLQHRDPCVTEHPVARFEAGEVYAQPLVNAVPWLARFNIWKRYPPTLLYRLDDSCRVDKLVFSVQTSRN